MLAIGLLSAGPALAHEEGLTPYRYVAAPPGVISQGPAESGSSIQPLGRFGFAGTTDNQMQLTLPEGALMPQGDQTGVLVGPPSGSAHRHLRRRCTSWWTEPG